SRARRPPGRGRRARRGHQHHPGGTGVGRRVGRPALRPHRLPAGDLLVISFRTHVVTLVAVFLALAIGVVLGGGPLSEIGRGSENAEALEADADRARAEAEFGERFATDASSALYTRKLEGREIALVTMPGADSSLVEAITEEIDGAGGQVVVTQAL